MLSNLITLPMKIITRLFLLSTVLLIKISALAQLDDITGIVNTYHRVVEIIPAKACFRVTNVGALSVNKKVLIVQMKGASIQTGTGITFGDTISLNQAGHYEIGTICYIIGDSVFLFHDILNSYNYTSGKVQLVQFSEHYSARVIGRIEAQLWDSTAGTGGVIALSVDESLELAAPIWGDTCGYKGGLFSLHDGTCDFFNPVGTLYAYNPTPPSGALHGAYKGESVASLSSISIFGAKGAPANGGGGGNNHNNSGGGGANLNFGGRGGGNHSGCCFGCFTPDNMGFGGKALSSYGGKKIFAGGGGGAGHNNYNGLTSGGGEGGGIVFIQANNLIGNGNTISANGGTGSASLSDGAGGGGAGGTIILDINSYTGALNIEAKGGKGGDSDNSPLASRCFGGGGGGSGGVIYFSGAIPPLPVTTSITGGAGGVETGSSGSCSAPVPGVAGINGQIISSYTYSRSTDEAGYCQLLLPVTFTNFSATPISKKVLLQWSLQNPAEVREFIIERSHNNTQWIAVRTVAANDNLFDYSLMDEDPFKGRSFYRIRIIEKNNSTSFSPTRQVYIGTDGYFSIYPNPASNKIIIEGNMVLPADLTITDVSGKILFTKKIVQNRAEIPLAFIQPGIYMVTINGITQKLVIQGIF